MIDLLNGFVCILFSKKLFQLFSRCFDTIFFVWKRITSLIFVDAKSRIDNYFKT